MCFRFEDQIPDHTNLYRFRNEIVAKKVYESLLKKINKDLDKNQAIVKTGVISGGSERRVSKANQSKKRKGKKEAQSGVNTQEKWLKKSGKLYYGYKNHIEGG
ncbi:MAG: hypothetical protein ACMUEL_03310 [Flavobacteriales bacterium Tduv]